MNKISTLLCAALFISSTAQGYTYNEEATAQLQEMCDTPQDRPTIKEMIDGFDQGIALVQQGANPNIITKDRNIPLLTGLIIFDFFCTLGDVQGDNPELQELIAKTHQAIKVLLDHGANPNVCHDDNGQTTLFIVSSAEIVRLLIDYGADRSIQDDNGQTALHYIEAQKLSTLDDIAQGKQGGFPFHWSTDTLRNLVAKAEQVIEVLKTYKIE